MALFSRYCQDDYEFLIDQSTGEVSTTIEGYSKLANLDPLEMSIRLSEAEPLTRLYHNLSGGPVRLIGEATLAAWLRADNPAFYRLQGQIGIRGLAYRLAGYQVSNYLSLIPAPPQPTPSVGSILVKMAQTVVEMETRMAAMEAQLSQPAPQKGWEYMTIAGYCDSIGVGPTSTGLKALNWRAYQRCQELGLYIGTIQNPAGEMVNIYPWKVRDSLTWGDLEYRTLI